MISTPTGKFGQLISKIFMNVDKLLPALYGGVLSTVLNLVVGVVLLGIFFGPIALALIVLYVAFTVAAYRTAEQAAIRNKDMMTAMFSEWGKLLAIAGSYERAHFFDRVQYEVSNAEKSFQTISTKMSAVLQGTHISSAVLQIISTGITVLCVAVIIPALANTATSLELAGLFFYFFTFVGGLEKYAADLTELRSALFEAQALSEFVKSRSSVIDQPGAVKLPLTPNPSIEFRNVSFSYQDKMILEQVSFKIEGGQTMGLVGASGCGKSTILRLLLRFYRPTTGSIYINGVDIQTMTGASLRSAFSVVTQTSQLFASTIRKNIEYGRQGASDTELLAAAKSAELVLEEGSELSLDKDVGESGAKLSGGQQQRVALARAMLKNGTIYLLDEPTTGLDGLVAQQLQHTLDALACQATTIMVTHNLDDLRQAQQILYMKDGKIAESGTYQSSEMSAARANRLQSKTEKKREDGASFVKGTLRNLAMTREHHKIIFNPSPLAKKFLYTFFAFVAIAIWALVHIQTHHGHHHIKKSRQQAHKNIQMERKLAYRKVKNSKRDGKGRKESDEVVELRRRLKKVEEENKKLKLRGDEL
eukprot:g5042.t1